MKYFRYIPVLLLTLILFSCQKNDPTIEGLLQADISGVYNYNFSTDNAVFSSDYSEETTMRNVKGVIVDSVNHLNYTLEFQIKQKNNDNTDEYSFIVTNTISLEVYNTADETTDMFGICLSGKFTVQMMTDEGIIGDFNAKLQNGANGEEIEITNGYVKIENNNVNDTMLVN